MDRTNCTYDTRFGTINKASAAEVRPLNDALANRPESPGGGVMTVLSHTPVPCNNSDNLGPHAALSQRPAVSAFPLSVEGAAA